MATSTSCRHRKDRHLQRHGGAQRVYTDEQKVVLLGGMPKMVDNRGNSTVGPGGFDLLVNDDRLIVNGSENQPASSRLKRK